jgi:carboxymethylenebutenolidase
MPTHWKTLQVDRSEMKALVAEPDTSGRHAGVVVIMGRTGIDEALQEQVGDLAAHGFVSIAPDMFHREDPSSPDYGTANTRVLDVNIEKDVNSAISYLQTHASVDPKRIGIVGFCMGGRISYLMATRNSEFKAAAVYYGGNIMKPRGDGPSPFEKTANINCPVIGLFGLDDENPSPADVKKIDAELTRLGKLHEFHSYLNAGHAFMGKGRPSYRDHAAKDAWPRTLNWFQKYLVAGETEYKEERIKAKG